MIQKALLAGLIDSDGYARVKGVVPGYEITNTNDSIKDLVIQMCLSLHLEYTVRKRLPNPESGSGKCKKLWYITITSGCNWAMFNEVADQRFCLRKRFPGTFGKLKDVGPDNFMFPPLQTPVLSFSILIFFFFTKN